MPYRLSCVLLLAIGYAASALAQAPVEKKTSQPPPAADSKDGAKLKPDASGAADSKSPDAPEPAAGADELPEAKGPDVPEKPKETPAAVRKFDEQFTKWKSILGELRTLMERYGVATENDEKLDLEKQFYELRDQGRKFEPELTDLALAALAAAPDRESNPFRWVQQQTKVAFDKEDFKETFRLSSAILSAGIDTPLTRKWAGASAFEIGKFALAAENLAKTDNGKPHKEVKAMHDEAVIRAAEAKADDLPRVRLHTTQGDVVLELYENEAPNTVANFISLVEKGFYNGTKFHRVGEGFVAQGGCPKGDGSGGPGHTIECECYKSDYRRHFRGVVSMAHAGRDTGGSQYFISYAQLSDYDGRHTVFGRVVEGLDVVAAFKKGEDRFNYTLLGDDADSVLRAEVIRKRDHPYKPKTKPAPNRAE